MKNNFQKPRGFRDMLPEDSKTIQRLYNIFIEICNSFNFWEIKMPLLESTNLFKRSLGFHSDIVSKEMYTIDDLTLRPEMTAQTVRLAIENNLIGNFCYFGECFRRERPQSNRYRQFYTFGVELLQSTDKLLDDIVVLSILDNFFKKINIKYKIYVNTIGTVADRSNFISQIKNILEENYNKLSNEAQHKFDNGNILRILDSKDPNDIKIIELLPNLMDCVNPESKEHFYAITHYLEENNFNWQIKNSLVRGLDYYNDLVFECVIEGDDYKKNLSICGGGRYDGLFQELGGMPCNAVGFGIGVDRILPYCQLESLEKKKILVNFINEKYNNCFDILRSNYILQYSSLSMKKMFNKHSKHYDYFIIFGEEWQDQKKVIIKDLHSGQQVIYPIADVIEYFQSKK